MNRLSTIAAKIGSTVVTVLLLVISCSILLFSFSVHHQAMMQQSQIKYQQLMQSQAEIILSVVAEKVSSIQAQMQSIAQAPEIAAALISGDELQIMQQQTYLTNLLPYADKVCLIAADVDKVLPHACLPITFASLNSLRQAKKEGGAPIAVMQVGTEQAHLLLAHRIMQASNVAGVLLVAMPMTEVEKMLNESYAVNAYIELQQGTKFVTKVASQGNIQFKQGIPVLQQNLDGSYWRLMYWAEPLRSQNFPLTLLIGLIIGLVVVWVMREIWQSILIKVDAGTLHKQIHDFQSSKLKPNYSVIYKVFRNVVDDIQTMGREYPFEKAKGIVISKQAEVVEQPLQELVAEQEIDPSIFKTYDIRGIVDQNLNDNVMRLIGLAIGSEAKDREQVGLVIGRDARLSSDKLGNALIEGILASGCNVIDIGRVPTPTLYFACEHLGIPSGVMLTGSHNPPEYNGLKIVFDKKALTAEELGDLYARIQQGNFHIGKGTQNDAKVIEDYVSRIVGDVSLTRSIKVVIDCGNAVAGLIAPKLFRELGCEIVELHCNVDGSFPHHHPNPSDVDNLQDLIAAVQQHDAELGIAFDGDGDRIGVVDINSNVIWPDRLMVLFAQDVLSQDPEATIIYDVKSTNLLTEVITRTGGNPIMSQSGYSLIKNQVYETGAKLAGEMSGHIFFNDRWYGFDDGLYTAARLLELLGSDALERTPTEVFSALPHRENTPEILIKMDESECKRFIKQLQEESQFNGAQVTTLDGLRVDFPDGWGLVRASNTMPCLSMRFEATSEDALVNIKQQFIQQMLLVKPTLSLSL